MTERNAAVDFIITLIFVFVGSAVFLSVFAPQFVPRDTDLFVYFLTDHIFGMVAGALVSAFLGSLANKEADIGIGGFVITVSVGSVAGIIVQYLLFQ